MNVHHLELFYYVARHGGISEAVRKMPYGIQQPAVSGQVAQLEEYLGVALFQRRPFALSAEGQKLYDFIAPFFSRLDAVALELQGGQDRRIRIGASTIVLRDHLPDFFRDIRKKLPNLRITLREGYQAELENLLHAEEIDLAITVLEKKSSPGIHSAALLRLPLALLAPRGGDFRSPDQLWKRDRIVEPLICLPESEAICKSFQQGLGRLGLEWFPGMEVSSIDLVETYVANGFGVGLSVCVPRAEEPKGVRVLPLPLEQFDPVNIGALWRGKGSPLVHLLLDQLRLRAKSL